MTISRRPTDLSLEEAMHYAELLDGKIHLGDEISPYTARDVIRDMEYAVSLAVLDLSIAHPAPKLTLFINSPGGGLYDAMSLYDFILELRQNVPVKGVVRGQAASAASMIVLQATEPRMATPNSRFLLHEPNKWGHGPETPSSAQDNAEELARTYDFILAILAERSGKHTGDIRAEIARREVWMSATEAKEWGLIDEIRGW